MKWVLSISFFSLVIPVFSQENIALLANKLTASKQTEKEKVTAIFKWITSTISYRVKPNSIVTTDFANHHGFVNDDKSAFQSLNERVAEEVLQKRVAVCDGYSRLFTTLCNYAGIRSEIIVGFAKSGSNKPLRRFGVNHYWNAVMIDSNWYLLDATWASGYISNQGGEFIREYDEKYFLTPPEIFIQDHYPDDARWTLLPDSEVPEEFRKSPFKQKSFSKYQINSYFPAKGVIDTFVGDTIRLKLETGIKEFGRNVSPDLLIDSAIFTHSPSWVFLSPDKTTNSSSNTEYNYNYTVASADIEWIYLLYNNDLVLRYKINVKNKAAD
jgi:hypothetical protein